jgi:hypothetical protein
VIMLQTFFNWLMGTSDTTDASDSNGSPVFSYVLVGAAVLLIVAMIFGELEDIA